MTGSFKRSSLLLLDDPGKENQCMRLHTETSTRCIDLVIFNPACKQKEKCCSVRLFFFLLFVIFHLLVTDLTSAVFMCVYIFVHIRVLLEVSCIYFTWNSSTQSQDNGVHPFGSVGFIVMREKRIMRLRLNKSREFCVGITALLLFPRDLLQASLLLCFH